MSDDYVQIDGEKVAARAEELGISIIGLLELCEMFTSYASNILKGETIIMRTAQACIIAENLKTSVIKLEKKHESRKI